MVEGIPRLITVEDAAAQPYATMLAYPHPDREGVRSRIDQLKQLGVVQLEFSGNLNIDRLSVLGKGVAGMVMVGITPSRRIALKVRRSDSRRKSVLHESAMLQSANKVGVGPEYLGNTPDVLAMQLVKGETLPPWLLSLKGRGRRAKARATLSSLLRQCYKLDQADLNHGELSRAHKNIIVPESGEPWILDFESASQPRRANNLTALTQYFFLAGGFSKRLARIVGPVDREGLITALRAYKTQPGKDRFDRVVELLKLQSES
jgi:putative serine/threonine protein kinase